jgi:hypothetical protein
VRRLKCFRRAVCRTWSRSFGSDIGSRGERVIATWEPDVASG